RVKREDGIIRKHTYLCDHARFYNTKSKKNSATKKMNCKFLINASCPKTNNPESSVYINKIVNKHNHRLNIEMIKFEKSKKFTIEMMDDIKFLTSHCKFGATVQRKFLEGKYPAQPIYSKDLYAAIQKFRPTSKILLNDAALMSNWLDKQKEVDPRWIVVRGWDEDNTLTKLFWMTPEQVENWIQFSDYVLNDVTHKTNRYGMALSLFVGFNRNRQNILLAQALLPDKSTESHIWMFEEVLKATGKQPRVIMTDADPAVDSAHLRNCLAGDYGKFIEAFYICRNSLAKETFERRFEDIRLNFPCANFGMISTSRVESVNGCLKRLLHSSNVSLCELMGEIHQLLDLQDKKEEYNFWKLAVSCIRSQEKANFLFKKIDERLER
ncbi:23325_t:CDS:2, partial [Gigaspora margarita]